MHRNKKAREGRARLLYLLIKYAKLWRCRCPRVVDLKLPNDFSPTRATTPTPHLRGKNNEKSFPVRRMVCFG